MSGLDEEWQGARPRLLSEINVTPFIDVMLVLLIVFMVTAPLMMVGVPLKLPKTSAKAVSPPGRPVVISLQGDGRLFLGQQEIPTDALATRLAPLIAADPDLVVYVRADKGVDYGHIMDLLGKLGHAGVARLSLVAEAQPLPGQMPSSGQTDTTPSPAP